ncbi:hypothetical protein M5D96_011893 [Drosophila gunungcola]|uniref:Uncharacterized protein n=1 Tax=Drosophila gunungcola TaxID=103775 RepID=A0A9Q0BKV8_9MUSC|nr:hypothetical protein M5D96_011893 [Drosophila gunungcola]
MQILLAVPQCISAGSLAGNNSQIYGDPCPF